MLYRMTAALARLLAPILSFTCEEVWGYTKFAGPAAPSVHMDHFPHPEDLTVGFTSKERELSTEWEKLLPIRERVLKALDSAREEKVIGSSLEATVHLEAGEEEYLLLQRFREDLPMWFITSDVTFALGQTQEMTVKVERARGDRCERCWRYTTDVGSNSDFPTVCARCAAVLPDFIA